MRAVEVRVHGRVQGVYYRATARAEGARLGLDGWVRNLADGSVQLRAQGDPRAVEEMVAWCRVGPPGARVTDLEVSDVAPDSSLSGFTIR